jgi:hypothetical protein
MKRIVFFLHLSAATFLSAAQSTQKLKKVVPLIQETFYLSGGTKAASGGKSRVYYKIDLPKNTIEWYYIITTREAEAPANSSLNLAAQLNNLLGATNTTGIVASAIIAPAGSAAVDVYLMNRNNADSFLQKVDNSGGVFHYLSSGTKENSREGAMQIKDAIIGTWYLGFRNPTAKNITIELEVAAIVEEIVENNSEWTTTTKENLYTTFYEGLKGEKLTEEEAKELSNCLVEKITTEKTPGQYYGMSETEKEAFVKERYTSCAAKYEDIKGPNYEKATNYANIGWKAFEKGNVDRCIEYSKMALELDSSLGRVKATLGLCYLVKNDEITAMDYYTSALADIKKLNSKSTIKKDLQATIDDLEGALKKYPGMKGAEGGRGLYEGELRKY